MLFSNPEWQATKDRYYSTIFIACLLLFLIYSFSAASSQAQAWTMPRGEHFLKITGSKIAAADQYTFDGRSINFINGVDGTAFRDESLYFYSEWGLFDKLTLVLSLPYKRTFVQDLAFKYQTFAPGTGTLGLRIALLPLLGFRPSAIAVGLNLGANIPMGYTRNYAPSAGAGQLDAQASLGIGVSFYPTAAYFQASGGYRYRSSVYLFSKSIGCNVGNDIHCIRDLKPSYGDELIFSAEAGIMFINGMLFFQALSNAVWSLEKPVIGFTAINPIPTHQRYVKAGGGFTLYPFRVTRLYSWAELGLSLQYFLTPYGRNTIASNDLFVGIEYRVRF